MSNGQAPVGYRAWKSASAWSRVRPRARSEGLLSALCEGQACVVGLDPKPIVMFRENVQDPAFMKAQYYFLVAMWAQPQPKIRSKAS